MSSMKINALEESLNIIQKRSRVRHLTKERVYEKLSEVEDILDNYLFKKDRVGLRVLITVFTKVPGSYNGIPMSTFVILERGTKVWKLVEVYRDKGIATDAKILNFDKFTDKICYKARANLERIITEID